MLMATPFDVRPEGTHSREPATVHVLVVVLVVSVAVAVVVVDVHGTPQNMGHTLAVVPMRQMLTDGRSTHRWWSVTP